MPPKKQAPTWLAALVVFGLILLAVLVGLWLLFPLQDRWSEGL